MRIPTLLIFLFGTGLVCSQDFPANVYNTNLENGTVQLWVDNDAYNPITVEISGRLTNMDATDGLPSTYVVPSRARKFHLTDFVPRPNKSWKFNFGTRLFHGDLLATEDYASSFIYALPCDLGKCYFISQGYNGKLSHHGENALDFDMPIGAPVYAARSGIVTRVVDKHNRSCPRESCNEYNNVISIYHEDGSFADYVHLDHRSAQVKPGDEIEVGQHIANSGNTGWTTGPHLHFIVYVPTKNGKRTLQTQFEIGENSVKYLKEGDKL